MKKHILILIAVAVALLLSVATSFYNSYKRSQTQVDWLSPLLASKSETRSSLDDKKARERSEQRLKDLIFSRYPELEPTEDLHPDGTDHFTEVLKWFESSEYFGLDLPSEVRAMVFSRAKFDPEVVGAFLAQVEPLLDRLRELSTKEPYFEFETFEESLVDDEVTERLREFVGLFSLSAQLALASEDKVTAEAELRAQLGLADQFSQGDLIGHLSRQSLRQTALQTASNYLPELGLARSLPPDLQRFRQVVRAENLGLLPDLVTLDRTQNDREFALSRFGRDQEFLDATRRAWDLPSDTTAVEILELAGSLDWDRLFLEHARTYQLMLNESRDLDGLTSTISSSTYDRSSERFEALRAEHEAARRRGGPYLPFDSFISSYDGFAVREAMVQRQLILREAINHAVQDLGSVTDLNQLVPDYLPAVPRHPLAEHQFIYNAEAGTLTTSDETEATLFPAALRP